MRPISLRLPEELLADLEREAAARGVGVSREAIRVLLACLTRFHGRAPVLVLARAMALQCRMTGVYLTDEEIEAAIEEGRE